MEATKSIEEMTTAELEKYLKDKKAEEVQKINNDKKALAELEDDYINKFIDKLINRYDSVNELVTEMFKDFEIIKPLKVEVKGVKIEKQYSHTFTSSNKDKALTIGYNYTDAFDGTEAEAITGIKTFLNSLDDDNPKMILANKMINILMKTNPKTGELNASKVTDLNDMRKDFDSDEFNKWMDVLLLSKYKKITSSFVSGWKNVEIEGRIKCIKFRFSV